MKTLTLYIMSAVLLAGCASSAPTGAPRTAERKTAPKKIAEEDKAPFIGMTKAEALARYGNPKTRTVTDEGERWTYVLNFGDVLAKHMIPFFFSEEQIRIGVLIFGPDGRVTKFNWDAPAG
jgi:hypothetical protein